MSLEDDARRELAKLEAAHRRRGERILEGTQGPVIRLDGRELINFASNDYLGLAGNAEIAGVLARSAESIGVGAGASRLIVGNHVEHVRLEAALCEWLGFGAARCFSSGYAANVGVMTTLLGPDDTVISDELNHASIIDGCRLSRATILIYPHGNIAALERLLSGSRGRRIVVTESLFSMDGDVPDLRAIRDLCTKHDAAMVVDEAHALGVFGVEGRGLCSVANADPDLLIGTFGKAIGTSGAFVSGSTAVVDWLWNRARSFVFSTGISPAMAAATRAAIELVRSFDDRRSHLQVLAKRFDRTAPIIPWLIGDDRKTMALTEHLLERGIFAQGIRPPTVPEGTARLRIALSALHSVDQVDRLHQALST